MASSDIQRLVRSIELLRSQLDGAISLDPGAAARLRTTLSEIETTLVGEHSESVKTSAAGFGHRLTAATRDFEDSHPALAGTLGSLIDALARMGI